MATAARARDDRFNAPGVPAERVRAFARAKWNTRVVRALRLAFPAIGAGAGLMYVVLFLQMAGVGGGVEKIVIPRILPENLAMQNPHYEGHNTKDGSSYSIRAETASPNLTQTNLVTLTGITGVLLDAKKARTTLAAKDGVFDSTKNSVDLTGGIDIAADSGLKAKLKSATMMTKEGLITSLEPVVVEMPTGSVRANQMTIRQKLKEVTFVDNVVAQLVPAKKPAKTEKGAPSSGSPSPEVETPAVASQATTPIVTAKNEAASPPSAESVFGQSDQPVDITAQRLDVSDATKTAQFRGNVRAVQGETTLDTPELQIFYEGDATGSETGTATSASQLKKMIASEPVITRANGDRITGATLEFDTAANRTVLTGGVVIASLPDRRVTGDRAEFDNVTQRAAVMGNVVVAQLPDRQATGDRAEFDQRADTALLTGTVVVKQGRNELRGRRLFLDRKAGLTRLTSPAEAGRGVGRITARFYRGEEKPGGVAKKETAKAVAKQDVTPPSATPVPTPVLAPSAGFASFAADPKAPVDVEADTLDVNDPKKVAVFKGKVRAVQGTSTITSSEMHAFYTGEAGLSGGPPQNGAKKQDSTAAGLERIEAKGNVVVTTTEGRSVTGDRAVFNLKTNTAVVSGNVVLKDGPNIVRGTRLDIDMKTGETKITTAAPEATDGIVIPGTPASMRPNATFFPKSIKGKGEKKTATPAPDATGVPKEKDKAPKAERSPKAVAPNSWETRETP